jgi:hypothetical protein
MRNHTTPAIRPQVAVPASWAHLDEAVRRRLELDGVHTPADWSRLTPRRRAALFGFPPSLRRLLNELARGSA